jgi:hypothetical protein
MKMTDFGLWFRGDEWSTSVPQEGEFSVFYNGEYLGWVGNILMDDDTGPLIIKIDGHYHQIRRPTPITEVISEAY